MRRSLAFSFTLLALVATALAGCASNREPATAHYRQGEDEMVYRARSINLGTMFPTGGMSRDPSVSLRTWAVCPGESCRPRRVWFSFVLRGRAGRSSVLSNRDVQIRTDGNVHDWPEDRQQRATGLSSGRGGLQSSMVGNELTRIRMRLSTLRDIATARGNVTGNLGNQDFSLSYEARAPLRALLQRIDEGGSPAAAS